MNAEQKLREAAATLLAAIAEARSQGLIILWPSRPEGLAALAISETVRAGTVPSVHPLNLSDEQRAALPPLVPDAGDIPAGRIVGEMFSDRRDVPAVGPAEPARNTAKPKKS